MAYYSFVVIAQQPVGIPNPIILLDRGLNTFNAEISDIDAFKKDLENENVVIKEVYRLDTHEPGLPTDLLLEGEKTESLLQDLKFLTS